LFDLAVSSFDESSIIFLSNELVDILLSVYYRKLASLSLYVLVERQSIINSLKALRLKTLV